MTSINTPDPADELLNRFMGQIFTNDNRLNHHEQSPEEHSYREKVYRAEAKAAIEAYCNKRVRASLARYVLAGMPELTLRQQEYITEVLVALSKEDAESQ